MMKQNLIGLNKQGEVISYDTAKKSLQDPPLTDFLNPLMDCPFPVLQIVWPLLARILRRGTSGPRYMHSPTGKPLAIKVCLSKTSWTPSPCKLKVCLGP